MPSLLALATPLALLLPLLGPSSAGAPAAMMAGSGKSPAPEVSAREPITYGQSGLVAPLDAFNDEQTVRQIRIEQRVIVRISPRQSRNRNELLAQLPQESLRTRYEERKMEKCLPVNRIAGVQTGSGNRLLLFMRDNRIDSVNLEKACRARDFYSGFYVERNEDGQLCVDRDELQSRSGAKCEVERMRQLVAVED